MTRLLRWAAIVLALVALLAPGIGRAAESAPVASARATATLVSDRDTVAPGGALHIGLRLRMAPGWHSYWRNPGDAGVAPELAFSLPGGGVAGPLEWPVPRRLAEGPLMAFGYQGEVLLPVTVTHAAPGPAALHASWLVCRDICVPEEGDFRLDLPAGSGAPSAQAGLFASAAAQAPRPSPFAARIAPDGVLTVAGEGLAATDGWFFPDTADSIVPAAPQGFSARDGVVTIALKPGSAFRPDAILPGVLVLRDRGGAETALTIAAQPGPAAPAAPDLPLLHAAGLAFLGGLILNLMPCVFPVLAMKAVGLARLSGAERRHAWLHALLYAVGVVTAFLGVAVAMLVLRGAGDAAGWGFQFQSPTFVLIMTCVLFAVGLNLSGVFLVGTSVLGAGQGLASRPGHAGTFFTGLLAVVVATPCTAPFMGAAIAAALAASPAYTLSVFVAMGLGLAAPFAVLAAIPAATRALPRPGRWMDILRQALAFPMYAATAWLGWVMSQEAGPSGVLATGAGLVLTGFGAWAWGLSHVTLGQGRRLAHAACLLAGLALVAVLSGVATAPDAPAAVAEEGVEPYSAARLAELHAEGRPVFVNMTAAWCVTCLVNERVALSPPAVRRAFAERGVAYLKGDWTRQDPAITAFLREHGRDGVPLYVLFPAGDAKPEVLPQILTEATVLDALGEKRG